MRLHMLCHFPFPCLLCVFPTHPPFFLPPFFSHAIIVVLALRKLMTRLDSQHYTHMLEEMLKERGVNVAELQGSFPIRFACGNKTRLHEEAMRRAPPPGPRRVVK